MLLAHSCRCRSSGAMIGAVMGTMFAPRGEMSLNDGHLRRAVQCECRTVPSPHYRGRLSRLERRPFVDRLDVEERDARATRGFFSSKASPNVCVSRCLKKKESIPTHLPLVGTSLDT